MLGTLPGPLGSWARLLDPDLAGVSWRRLGNAGQGSWACLGLGLTLWHSLNTLTHTPSKIPGLTLKVLLLVILGLFELCTFFSSFGTFYQIGTFCSFGNLWPHIGHQNVTGPPGALLFDVKPEIAKELL